MNGLANAAGARARSFTRQAGRAWARAAALTTQLLAFSRQQAVTPQVLDPAASVRGLAPLLQRLIGEALELRLTLAHGTGGSASPRGSSTRSSSGRSRRAEAGVADGPWRGRN